MGLTDEQRMASLVEKALKRKAAESEEPEAKKKRVTRVEDEASDYEIGAIERLHAEENEDLSEDIFDKKLTELLDPVMVQKAKREDVEFMQKIDFFEEVILEQCWSETGKAPIDTKFV